MNTNLARHMQSINDALKKAEATTWASHVHAGVRADACGTTQTGPVLSWTYDPQDPETFGSIEVVNYRGETLRKPLRDVFLYDIRPCGDRCEHAPTT